MTSLVEQYSDLTVGVLVEEFIDGRHDLRLGLAKLPGSTWERELERPRGTATKADVRGELVAAQQSNVFDDQPHEPFAFACGRAWVPPDLR